MARNLKNIMIDNAIKGLEDNHSITAYKRHIRNFDAWRQEQGYTKKMVLDKPVDCLNSYVDYLYDGGKSAATVHTYLAPACKGLGVHMDAIKKPKRRACKQIQSRAFDDRGARGRREAEKPEFSRLVDLQRCVGLRRSELAKLTGKDLGHDRYGDYIHVARGKGGKEQYQRILPGDRDTVRQIFAGVAPDEKVFAPEELNNKISLHALRAEHARDCYDYYLGRIEKDTVYAKYLENWMIDYFKQMHRDGSPERREKQLERFLADIRDNGGRYVLRSANKKRAEEMGRPTEYNRLALMAVSVFHLSHWRNSVTVCNYMI